MADDLLLLDQVTSRLYELPVGSPGSVTLLSGSVDDNERVRSYLALPSRELVYADPIAIAPFVVEDSKLSDVLTRFDVDGLRTASSPLLEPDRRTLPLFGNLVDPTWLAVQVGGQCDSSCTFCFTEWIRHQPKLTFEQIIGALDEAAGILSVKDVVFTGGEPTLRTELPSMVAHAAERGFRLIGIQTNGHRIADPAYLDRLASEGMNQVLLSMHGAHSATHDGIARRPGSHKLAYRALIALSDRAEVRTEVNFVICPQNIHEAQEIVALVSAVSPTTSLRFSFPIIEGAAFDNRKTVLLTLESYVEAMTGVMRSARDSGIVVSTANVPPCVATEIGLPPTYALSQRSSMLGISPFVSSSIRRGELSAKVAACEGCVFDTDCGGLQLAYLRRYPLAGQNVKCVTEATKVHQ